MPFQGLPWTEFISCPVCFKLFNERQQRPISLGCGHTVCKSCIKSRLTDNRCPFDQTMLPSDVDKLPANFALMHLVGAAVPEQEKEAVRTVSDNPKSYEQARKCIEEMAVHLKPLAENASDDDSSTCSEQSPSKSNNHNTAGSGGTSGTVGNSSTSKCVLSRPMQRKLISLIHCQLLEEEGRSRAARIARSLGERIVSELLVMHQYPHQLSANLWAAVRTRGCQFLGPAMQEEVLKLILLALEDGSFLSRKVLVLFVVQRLESRYPQASKTAIGHVVQLLYRASCFKVLKREEESSLMQLKEEFRQYESLRREHDSQIVEIAIEAGLRISPEQWSSLLYGDPAHKSHMQSIIDKHQSPQSFAQSVTELMLTLQRSNDHSGLLKLQPQLEFLSNIDPSPDCPAPSWENLEAIMRSLNTVMTAFVEFLSNPDHKSRLETAPVQNTRYKTSMCRDFSAKGSCPRGNTCTFAHSQDELERYRSRSRRNGGRGPVGVPEKTSSSLSPFESDQLRQVQLLSKLKVEAVARNGAVKVSGSSQSADEFLDPKFFASTLSSEASPVFTKPAQTQGHAAGMIHSKLSPRAVDAIGNKCTEPEKPPFVPPPPQLITETRLTFSCPGLDGSDTPNLPTLGPQTCFHPNSHNAYAHAPLLQNPLIHSPPIRPHHVSAQGTHLMMQPPFPSGPLTRPPSHHVLQNVPIAHGSQNLPVARGSQSLPMALGSQSLPVALGSQSLPVALGSQSLPMALGSQSLPVALGSQSLPVALGSSTSTQAVSAFIPSGELGFSSVNMTASHQQAADTTAMCNSCIPYIQVHHVERQHPMPYALQVGDSLEDLAIRKQQIINHLQVEPVFMESGTSLQLADGHKGFAGLKTVLTNNKQMQEAMPKSVSDMFVATRSTQSLDELLNDDIQQYSSKWSLGEINHGDVTSGGSDTQLDPSPRGPLPDSRTTNSISFSMGARPTSGSLDATGNNRLHTSVESATRNADVLVTTQSSSSNEAEFCSFPNDDNDESFIPFEHVSVSRFGPISRMSKIRTYNSAPVQVTAESYKWMTPVLSVTPLDRPVATSMQMPTRFPPRTGTELLTTEPAVKPTPTEIPSIWQQPPQPSYRNIALMKAGAAEAVTNNERLAYELQAIELEIALKTGKEPEPVTKIIQDAVMAPSQVQTLYHPTSDLVTSKGNSFMTVMGRGHVTDCLANIEAGASLVPPQQAAQHFMEDYYRSWQGIKK